MVRAYHATSASSGTPDSFEPHGNGTRIVRGNAAGALSNQRSPSPLPSLSNRKDQSPFRLTHSARSRSGRGCSGRGISVPCACRGVATKSSNERDAPRMMPTSYSPSTSTAQIGR